MIAEITKLYDNFLARFKFFRRFISVLIELNFEMEKNRNEIKSINDRIDKLDALTKELKEVVESNKSSDKQIDNTRTRTAHNLLDKFKEAVETE